MFPGPARTLPLLARALMLVLIATLCGLIAPSAARAHGEGDSDESLVLVRQAIAYIVNKPGDDADVEDKINDALEAPMKDGVDLSLVSRAKQALMDGDMRKVRNLLQAAIGARPYTGTNDPVQIGHVPPALTGEDTGTLAALDALPGRHGLDGGDWALLIISLVVGAAGLALAIRLRPHLPHQPTRPGGAQ
jgi:hypothetical protein